MTILLGARLGLSFVVLITVFRFGTTTRILQQLDHNELERNVALFDCSVAVYVAPDVVVLQTAGKVHVDPLYCDEPSKRNATSLAT